MNNNIGKIHIIKGGDGCYYARYVAPNGLIQLDFAEGYKKKSSLRKAIESIREEFPFAPIVDDTIKVTPIKWLGKPKKKPARS